LEEDGTGNAVHATHALAAFQLWIEEERMARNASMPKHPLDGEFDNRQNGGALMVSIRFGFGFRIDLHSFSGWKHFFAGRYWKQ
jgi:hypothetical protein